MSQATDTDLTRLTDTELDAALQVGLTRYAEAKKAGDEAEVTRLHAATMRILDIQAERRHAWLDTILGLD